MVIGSTGNELEACFLQFIRHLARIADGGLLIRFEGITDGLFKGHRLGGNDVHQRTTLDAGKYFLVEPGA